MRVTVFGATGGIGRAVVHELLTRGHEPVAANPSADLALLPTGTRVVSADLLDAEQARRAASHCDVVVMAANVGYRNWARLLPTMVDNARDAAVAAGARLVMVDNLYAFGSPSTPITDRTPEAPTSRKGMLRRDLVASLLSAHERGDTAVSVARISDYYGPGGTNSVAHQLMIGPALDGKPVRTYIADDQPHTFAYLPDAANSLVTLVEQPRGDGRSWILPAAPAVTQREFVDLLEAAVGGPVERGHVSPMMLRVAGVFDRNLRQARELVDQWNRPYVVEARDFEATFGPGEVTGHAEALAQTVDWFRRYGHQLA